MSDLPGWSDSHPRKKAKMSLYDKVLQGFGPEDWEHKAVVDYCEARSIDVFHIPNSTWTKSPMVRIRNTILGVRAGIPDLCVVLPGIGLLFIEMKQTGQSKTSVAQKAWIALFNMVPCVEARVCKGAEVAIAFIEEYYSAGHRAALPRRPVPQKAPKPDDSDDSSCFKG
jgi:hypothetical protein